MKYRNIYNCLITLGLSGLWSLISTETSYHGISQVLFSGTGSDKAKEVNWVELWFEGWLSK